MEKRFTIYDLAKSLGLSVSTASKALNGYPDINPETRRRVLEEAQRMGFEPNSAARSITTKRSYLIGIVYREDGEGLMHPHFAEILENFRKAMEEHGYQLMFIGDSTGNVQRTILQTCRYRSLDGVLVMAVDRQKPGVEEFLNSSVPMVLVDFEWPGRNSVLSDNQGGMEQVVDHLYELGHRDFLYLSAPRHSPAGEERLMGVTRALESHGIALPPSRIVEAESFDFKSGYQAVERALKNGTEFTAVITAYDRLAFGAIYCLREHGLRVPEDVSITGFDDLNSDQMFFWQLTTVEQQRSQIGAEAARVLLKSMLERKHKAERFRLPVRLVKRATCRSISVPSIQPQAEATLPA